MIVSGYSIPRLASFSAALSLLFTCDVGFLKESIVSQFSIVNVGSSSSNVLLSIVSKIFRVFVLNICICEGIVVDA